MLFILVLVLLSTVIVPLDAKENIDSDILSTIRTVGDPILQTPVRKLSVEEIQNDESIKQAITTGHSALLEFRALHGFGRAIAAPQFGYSLAMICLFLHGQRITMFNPEIISKSTDTFLKWDDCLSFPDKVACVRRHKSISIAFMDENGAGRSWINLPIDLAELLQHEIDHLYGVLALDIAEQPPVRKCSEVDENDVCEVPKVLSRPTYEARRSEFDSYLV